MSLPLIPALEPVSQSPVASQPYYVAVMIDDVVRQVMNLDGQSAALFLSAPKIVQCDATVAPGMTYNQNSNTFSFPAPTN
jgi:hypothetical protein